MPETLTDSAGYHRSSRQGWLPGQPVVGDQGSGESELGEGGQDQPGPPVGLLGRADLRGGPAEGLFREPEGVLDVEPADGGAPDPVEVQAGLVVAVPPQPQGFRLTITASGQPRDLQPDQGALDDAHLPTRVAVGALLWGRPGPRAHLDPAVGAAVPAHT